MSKARAKKKRFFFLKIKRIAKGKITKERPAENFLNAFSKCRSNKKARKKTRKPEVREKAREREI